MNPRELRAERIRKGKRACDLSSAMGITEDAYRKKEKGEVGFTPDQIIVVTRELDLSADMLNAIFFDKKLPIGRRKKTG